MSGFNLVRRRGANRPPSAADHYRRRQEARRAEAAEAKAMSSTPSLAALSDVENLLRVYDDLRRLAAKLRCASARSEYDNY